MQGMGSMGAMGMPPAKRLKTMGCRHFEKGFCQMGESCSFAHGDHELGMPAPAGGGGMQMGQQAGGGFKKSKLCNFFAQTGACKNGANCTFAHGEHELGTPQARLKAQAAQVRVECKWEEECKWEVEIQWGR